jgi:hypothetical protein
MHGIFTIELATILSTGNSHCFASSSTIAAWTNGFINVIFWYAHDFLGYVALHDTRDRLILAANARGPELLPLLLQGQITSADLS